MTESSKQSSQTQQSQTNPWAPAIPLATSLLGKYQGQNTDVTGGQKSALDNLTSATSNIPNFGASGAQAITNLFSSNNQPQVGVLNDAYSKLNANLNPIANGSQLNPYSTPGFGDALATTMDDITNRVKSSYNGSGRDPSGAGSFAQSLGRGLTQGVSPLIQSQYNTNRQNMMSANGTLFGGATTNATGTAGLTQQQLQNGVTGITAGTAAPNLYTAPAMAQFGAANAQYGVPYSNLSQLLTPSVSLAGLGNTSSGSAQGTQTSSPSLMDSITSGFGMAGKGASALGSLFALSDERAKTDKEKVGKLFDGTDVYSFKYLGDRKTHVGLMAQDIERDRPEAVAELPGGLKMVNYDLATRRARAMAPGRVGALLEAA